MTSASTASAADISRQALSALLEKEPGAVIETFAQQHGVTPRAVVEALPEAMRRFGPGSAFVEIMQDVGHWGDVTVIVHSEDGIMETTGPVPAGAVSHGYYNVPGRTGFHGHLRHDRCAAVAFVERPFMGRESAFITFFNLEGGIMFKIFVGRDEKRDLKQDQLAAFRALAEKYAPAG